jgi:AraC-like DNA-binding protein
VALQEAVFSNLIFLTYFSAKSLRLDVRFSLFEVFLIIGITNGFVISVIIWFAKRKEPDKILLSIILTVFNLLCLKIMMFTSGLWQTVFFRYFPLPFELAIQPLVFLYIASLTSLGFRLSKKHLLHFIPFAISFAYSLFVYLTVLPETDLLRKDAIADQFLFNGVKKAEDFLSLCSAVIYWYCGLRLLLRYRNWLYNDTSNTLFPTYTWLKNILVLFALFFLMLSVNILLDYGFDYGLNHFLHWQILFVYLAILIYYMGVKGYQQAENQLSIFPGALAQKQDEGEDYKIFQNEDNLVKEEIKLPTDEKVREASEAIIHLLVGEKIYLDPELNIQSLAQKLNLSPAFVSLVINSAFKKNFRNLINEYRVEEVKRRLEDPKSGQLSLLGIAYECGFNSEASFYRIFKNRTGVAPKEYLLRKRQP